MLRLFVTFYRMYHLYGTTDFDRPAETVDFRRSPTPTKVFVSIPPGNRILDLSHSKCSNHSGTGVLALSPSLWCMTHSRPKFGADRNGTQKNRRPIMESGYFQRITAHYTLQHCFFFGTSFLETNYVFRDRPLSISV